MAQRFAAAFRRNNPPMPTSDMRRVLAAEAVSNFGSMLSRLAIPFLATLLLQASAADMAALLVADVLAGALGAWWLGSLIDRHGKRAVMLLADAGRALLLATLALLAWRGALGMPMLLAAAAASGVLTMAFEIARSAWMAQRVAEADLPAANARLSVAGSVSEAAAFAIGGWLYQGLGAVVALAVDACSYAASALCLRGVREAPAPERPAVQVGAWRALKEDVVRGLHAIAADARLRSLAAVEALLALGMALTGTSYMIHVSRDVALAAGPLGTIAALGALGAVAGAAVAPALGHHWGTPGAMGLGLLAMAAGAACIPLAQTAGWWAIGLLIAHQIVGDAGHTLYDVHGRTLRQTAAAPELLARVDAGIRFAGQTATLVGALLGGLLGTAFSARSVLWLAAAVTLAAAAVVWRRRGAHLAAAAEKPA
jgi:MFS family permease